MNDLSVVVLSDFQILLWVVWMSSVRQFDRSTFDPILRRFGGGDLFIYYGSFDLQLENTSNVQHGFSKSLYLRGLNLSSSFGGCLQHVLS